ncbi:AT DNA binding protein (Thy28), putative [Talaromyces stipitatus ATCC 10500]|uniref:Thymocyte nuclear protein 1 n=1 Tax=Talaromyces stipitatus (strain ATCC 10500 / CBS 375.48 / QM 6759 / NRRL 1006) TaxID=441959 RepID=B8MHV8_TALSN|nr:AT DNA binding protein (Thy28), putative [Talaromyces stipitatus ATCC 10500]EED16438.1 AT DNA binding protein (Thy28), putative [Talaromyces stipitatus ATCC 10500]
MPPKKRTSTVANADATEPPSKRTRKPAGSETAAASRPKRFSQLPPRAARIKAAAPAPAPKPSPAKRTVSSSKARETPQKRGRPQTAASPAAKKGKPAKSAAPASKATVTRKPKTSIVKTTADKPGKRHGRPPKSSEPASTEVTGKKRKRATGQPQQAAGKPAKKQTATRAPRAPAFLKEKEPDLTIEVAEEDAFGPDGHSYWLMKAEPQSRIVKGVDVKFSIDDLQAASEPEPWDARNNMRAMKKGDFAFFYHSSCKVPGIVGQMEIVREHSVDESAFDPAHPYYDEKSSRENPKWEVVHVEFRRKFDQPLTLETLKSYALSGQPLENLQTLRQSRVSVSRVSPQEWDFIMGLINQQEADAKKASAKEAPSKETTEVNGQLETENTDETPREPTAEAAPRAEHGASVGPAAEPEATSTLAGEPSVPAPVADQTEDQASKAEEVQVNGEKSTKSDVNGPSTAERITSVFTGGFLN